MKTAAVVLLAAVAALAQPSDKIQKLEEIFTAHAIIQLDPEDIDRQVKVFREPLAIEVGGERFVFEMEPRNLLSDRYRAEVTGDDGLRRSLPTPEVNTFKGTALGAPHIRGRFTITKDNFNGVVFVPGDWLYIEPVNNYLPDSEPAEMVAYRDSTVIHDEPFRCGASSLHHFQEQHMPKVEIDPRRNVDFATEYTVDIATEADYEFVREFRNVREANREILSILNRVEGVYEDSLNLKLEVIYQHGWDTRDDPYSSSNGRRLLEQFQVHWNSNFLQEGYDLAHMWSGKDLDVGGTAWIGPVCRSIFHSYGLSQYYPDAPSRIAFRLAAHEMGHGFDATHPDEESPPIANCQASIMQSGWSERTLDWRFCNFSRRQIRNHVSVYNSCFPEAAKPPPPPPPPPSLPAPSGLTAEAVSSTEVRLEWQDNSPNERGFRIERRADGRSFEPLGWNFMNRVTFFDFGLVPSTLYDYRVLSYTADNRSAWSNIAKVTTPATDRPAPPCGCPSDEKTLISGAPPREFTLPAVEHPTHYGSGRGFMVNIPAKATSMNIMLKTTTPGVDVDMFASYGVWSYVWDGRMFADHSSTGLAGDEQIFVVPDHDPPLRPGIYFISFGSWTISKEATATIQVIVE